MPVYPNNDEELSTVDAVVDAILVDTNELQTDLTDGGRLDLIFDAIKASTDNLPSDPADASVIAAAFAVTDGKVDAVKAETALIVADTNEIQSDLVDGGRLDLLIDAIKAKTDGLPVDPADASDITAQFAVTDGLVTTVDGVVDAIKLSTDNLPSDPADASVIAAAFAVTDGLVTTVDTVVDGIVTDIGDPSGDTLTSLTAKFGDDTATLKARLDTIDSSIAGIGGVASGENKGSFSYLDAGAEQDLVELTVTDRKIVYGAFLDMVNLTQDGTIKVYAKIDGTNYREILSEGWKTTDSDGVFVNLSMGVTDDLKITYTEAADEGAARAIPYSIVWSEIQ